MQPALTRFTSPALLCLFLAVALPAQAQRNLAVEKSAPAERRVALVIGNGAYASAPLKNPPNDARDMAGALRRLGFTVIEKINVPQKEMNRAIAEFGEKLNASTMALFFYAGHGMQVKGKNYLLPIDARINSESSVRAEAVDVDAVLDQFAASPLNVVILDACRNNPFERKFRSVGGGLAQMDAPKGTLIAYATAPGKVASDGDGRNGLYTQELLRHLQTPGLSVEVVFKRVRAGVARATGDAQIPWEASSLTGEFHFRPDATARPAEVPATTMAVDTPEQIEQQFWNRIRDSQDSADFEDYLKQYPQGRFVAEARLMVRKLGGAKQVAAVQPPVPASAAPPPRSWFGVQIQGLTPELAASFGLKEARGALVVSTAKGGPAEKAGMESGDVVVEFQGQAIQNFADLPPMVASSEPGAQINVRVIRRGQMKDLAVTLGKPQEAASQQAAGKLGSDLEKFFGSFSGGVLFSQIKSTYQQKLVARGFELLPNDRITRVVRQGVVTQVKSPGDIDGWLAALDSTPDVSLSIVRDGKEAFQAGSKPK
jgi:hypothetical protein